MQNREMKSHDIVSQDWIRVINAGRTYLHSNRHFSQKSLNDSTKNLFSRILRAHISDEGTVLEAGCGEAYFSLALAQMGVHVTALDISDSLIRNLDKSKDSLDPKIKSNLEFIDRRHI